MGPCHPQSQVRTLITGPWAHLEVDELGLAVEGAPLNSRPDATCLWITPLRSRCIVRARMSLSIFVPPTGFRSTSSLDTWDDRAIWKAWPASLRAAGSRDMNS